MDFIQDKYVLRMKNYWKTGNEKEGSFCFGNNKIEIEILAHNEWINGLITHLTFHKEHWSFGNSFIFEWNIEMKYWELMKKWTG